MSNLMIEEVISEGYSDSVWESRLAEALHHSQLSHLQCSSAFMSPEEALQYYSLNRDDAEEGH